MVITAIFPLVDVKTSYHYVQQQKEWLKVKVISLLASRLKWWFGYKTFDVQ